MNKITFMGAGSTVFVRNVLGDCMCSDALKDWEYALYDIDYFIEKVPIEKHDFRVSEDVVFKLLETLIADNVQYTITDIYTSIFEMEHDLNNHASTFFNTAYSEYKSYIAEIEAIELEAKNIIDNLYGSEYNSTKTYKRPNIVYYNYSAFSCKCQYIALVFQANSKNRPAGTERFCLNNREVYMKTFVVLRRSVS